MQIDTTRIKRQDRLVKSVPSSLMFGDQLRLELAVAVARDLDFDFRFFGLDFLSGRTVAGIAAVAPGGVMLFIAEQVG